MSTAQPDTQRVGTHDRLIVNPGTTGTSLRIIRTIAAVEEIREIWTAWNGHRDSDIDFYLEFIQAHRGVLRPHVIVLYRAGRADAILIGRLGLRGNSCDENSVECIKSILCSLRSGEADMAFFHQTAADSAFYQRALRLPGLGARDHLARPEPHHIMQLPARIENLYEGLSAGLRKQLRRDRKKLSEKYPGKIRIHCFRHSADIGEAARDMEEVARKTYQRGLGVGFADNMGMRTRLQLFSQKGWLRAWVLYLNDVPCSFWTGTVYNGVLYLDYIAYDPALREYSPGTLLMMKALEDLCSEGVGAVDFGFGQADYKQRFGNVRLMESSIYIYAPSLKGLLLNAMRTAPILIDRVSKTILSRTKLLPKVKKLWRKRVTNP